MDDSEAWEVQNQRRIELIRKSAVETLTEAEQAELQSLQDAADRRLEERDWALLTQLDRLKRAIEQRASEARCTPAGTTAPGACTPRVQRVRWGMAKTPGCTLPRCWRKSAVCFSYSRKVFLIVRQHNEIIVQGGCAKQNIKIRNQLTPSAKVGADFRKLFYDGKVQGKKLKVIKK